MNDPDRGVGLALEPWLYARFLVVPHFGLLVL